MAGQNKRKQNDFLAGNRQLRNPPSFLLGNTKIREHAPEKVCPNKKAPAKTGAGNHAY
jgi:hypothetical protein